MDKNRNYGIDLLRVLAMFFIVVLHSLGHGGILYNVIYDTPQYKIAWFMEILAFCGVDIFAIISGYVSYHEEERKVNIKNYIKLWLQVVFYSVLITTLFGIFLPNAVSGDSYIMAIFPVTNKLYWYFTAYTGLFILMPFINKALRNTNVDSLKKLFVMIILTFSIYDTIVDKFNLGNGYSFIWLLLLYIIGQIIKKCEIGNKLNGFKIAISILILTIITYVYKMYGFEFSFINIKITKGLLISYTSPTVLCMAILYVIGFSKMKFNNLFKKIIKFFAISSFSVYLINDNPIFRDNIIVNLFINLIHSSVFKIFAYVIIFSILFLIAATLIDKIRLFLFKILHIDLILDTLVEKINNKNERTS